MSQRTSWEDVKASRARRRGYEWPLRLFREGVGVPEVVHADRCHSGAFVQVGQSGMISSLHHERLAFSDDRLCTLAGNVVYLAGCILLTMGYHVPRNEALDELDAAGR